MSGIVIAPSPITGDKLKSGTLGPADYMPLSARVKVAAEINKLWAEFVNEMHDGSTHGRDVAEKFWAYVTR